MLIGLYLVVGPKITLSRWRVTPEGNTALDEALQWRQGSLALSHRFYECAEVDGRCYNVVGPLFTLLSVVATFLASLGAALSRALGIEGASAGFSPLMYVGLVALPLPLVGFWAFRTVVKSSAWAAVLTAYLIAGTGLTPVLATCRGGSIYYINHVLAVVGLLVFAADLLGRQRIWPAAIGLCMAAWSRQTTCLYALPLLWIAWRGADAMSPTRDDDKPLTRVATQSPQRPHASRAARPVRRRLVVATIGVAIAGGLPMMLNTLKFGNPLETGYRRLFEGRGDAIGRRGHEAVFGLRYVGMHAWAMNVAFPRWDIRAGALYADTSAVDGASIWWSSPLLLAIFVTGHRWWSDHKRRALMLGTLPVIAGLMCYCTTSANDAGYYRYSLDFIPIWLLVIAPYTTGRRGVPLTLACLGYSALYFRLVP